MKRTFKIGMLWRVALLTALLGVLLCQSVTAKGVDTNYSQVNGQVSQSARRKYTKLRGKGKDQVTLMVYMIGTDLESRSGMGTSDLNEMLYANIGSSRVNVLVETGGCKRWHNSVIKAGKIQRWTVSDKGLGLLTEKEASPMTYEDELADFIRYCADSAPANRYMLILWDHGGGSVSGYGYDETFPNATMDIGEIAKALDEGGVKFDFIGFDACLMATLENAIAVEPYADYLIASEESEPGTGWYYTNWLKMLNENSSTNTLNLGRQICDDFTSANAKFARVLGTTLSVTDLAELSQTVKPQLGSFGKDITMTLKGKNYQAVADARSSSREFSPSSHLDQVDVVDFCKRLGTEAAKKLSEAVQSSVKYNRVANMTNAYGLSIYFPNASLKSVNSMISLCDDVGIDGSWGDGIRAYAALSSSGQLVADHGYTYGSGSGSLLDVLLGSGSIGNGAYSYDTGYDESTSSSGAGSFLQSLLGEASSGSYDTSTSTGSLLETLLGGGSSESQSQSASGGLLETLLGCGTSQYGSGNSWEDSYANSYDSYESMSEQDILSMLMQAYSSSDASQNQSWGSGNGYYGSSAGNLIDALLGGYASTDGTYYGGNSYSSVFGNGYGSGSSAGQQSSAADLLTLAAQMLSGREMVGSETLKLTEKDGQQVLVMDEDKWDQVTAADLNVFVDDGEGYLDLGLDNVLEYTEDGDLIDAWDGTWLTLNGQPVALYPVSDEDVDGDGLYITTKYIPALLNEERVNLIVEFNEETGEDSVLGAQKITETGVLGKGYIDLEPGDLIQPVCDYFTYEGAFESTYKLGDVLEVPKDGVLNVANMKITGGERMLYTARLTDIYQAHYWLPMTEAEAS